MPCCSIRWDSGMMMYLSTTIHSMYLGYNQLYSCDDYNVDRGYDDSDADDVYDDCFDDNSDERWQWWWCDHIED